MAQERYRHIFLVGPTRTQQFRSPRHGGSEPRIPRRDRFQHGAQLQQRLQDAWTTAEQRQAVAHVDRQGTYMEFVSEPGFDLALNSLENSRSGIRLLNVQRRGAADSEQTLATVYIPNGQRSYFLNKIRAYTEEDLRGKPKNAKLVNSVSDIRLSVLESFWQDKLASLPGDETIPVEVWLSSDSEEVINKFDGWLGQHDTHPNEGTLKFPERSVKVIHANRQLLQNMIEGSDDVAELRGVSSVSLYAIESEPKEQLRLVQRLLERSRFEPASPVVVCILDTGVNNGHPLIKPVLADNDLHAANAAWGTNDHDGHGTLMAGIAGYGDLMAIASGSTSLRIAHRLESAKILPPPPGQNSKELWGYWTAQGLSRAEIQAPQRKRITCMAVTSAEDRDRGRPSSWSAMIDALASGYEDDTRRLIIISAGNVEDGNAWRQYPTDNLTNEIHDPAQAWNALTVGAFTRKVEISDPDFANYHAVAPADGLSPYSTTSLPWSIRRWPIKPDILVEGGNVASGPNESIVNPDDLQLLSTGHDPQTALLAPFGATSAASAQAAWIAAQIQDLYPSAWPETIRALMVHSARWTDTMKSQFLPQRPAKGDYANLLRICGYGVPHLQDALYCAANSLTLISQAELQPFDRIDRNQRKQYVTRDMHIYTLPWPKETLSDLGETQVEMRVTLSYFVEPGPGEIGWESRYRYASHGLRFDINGPSEAEQDFIQRINVLARDEGMHPGTEGAGGKWVIGSSTRNLGSIHSDIWQGSAADLAGSNLIAVYPTVGWWRERHHLQRWEKRCRYSLIVSVHTPSPDIDIYTPVAVQIGSAIPVEIQATS